MRARLLFAPEKARDLSKRESPKALLGVVVSPRKASDFFPSFSYLKRSKDAKTAAAAKLEQASGH